MRIIAAPPTADLTLTEAVDCLRRGGLVAYPTDTLYGLGAAARDDGAVRRLFQAKNRPLDNPMPILVVSAKAAESVAQMEPSLALRLASHFWPGGLTLVLPREPGFQSLALAGGDTVAVRVPDHRLPLALIRELGEPLTGTSANVSGGAAPLTAAAVAEQLADFVDIIIDGGRCPGGMESTVLDLTGESPRVLREGAISRAELESVIGSELEEVEE
jgi:L-threonylcarbamoyladenylate synthase